MKESSPIASVLILAYNQAHLIGDTLSSVFAQKTSFPFEVVIGDDASTDDTAGFCEKLADGDSRLRILRHPKNLGHIDNFITTLSACRGRYVALLGGDDIWTDPTKLERQVRFLINHTDYALSHTHYERLIHATGKVEPVKMGRNREGKVFKKLVCDGNFVTASTIVFDSFLLSSEERETIRTMPTEDYPLLLTLTPKGKLHHLREVCVRYRILNGSLGRPVNPGIENLLKAVDCNEKIINHYCGVTPGANKLLPRMQARMMINKLRLLMQHGEKQRAKNLTKKLTIKHFYASPRLLFHWLKAQFPWAT